MRSIIFRSETIDSSILLRKNPGETYRHGPRVISPKLSHNGKHEDFINPNKGMAGVIRDNFGAYWLATLISGVLTFAILHLTFSLPLFFPSVFLSAVDPTRDEARTVGGLFYYLRGKEYAGAEKEGV